MTVFVVLYLTLCSFKISVCVFTGLSTKTNFHLKIEKSRILNSGHSCSLISIQILKLKGQYVYTVNYTLILPPFSYQTSALQALLSAKDQLQSEKDACDNRIKDLKYLLDEKSSQLSQYSEKIASVTDNLQRNEKRFSELEIENKSLEGELRAQRTAFDRVQTDLNAMELKLRDSVSKVSDLYAEIEMKTASGLELKAVSLK